jgi:hypothetical protein
MINGFTCTMTVSLSSLCTIPRSATMCDVLLLCAQEFGGGEKRLAIYGEKIGPRLA